MIKLLLELCWKCW